jgi:hypothetical protein
LFGSFFLNIFPKENIMDFNNNDGYKNFNRESYLDAIPKLDLIMAYSQTRTEKDFIIPGFRAGGTVGAIITPDSGDKNNLALEIAYAVACPQADIAGFKTKNSGKVLYLNAEDL